MPTNFDLSDPAVLAQLNAILAQQGGKPLGLDGKAVESSTGTSGAVTPSKKRSRSDTADTGMVVDPTTTDQSPERKKKRADRKAAKAARKAAKAAEDARKAAEEVEEARKKAEAEKEEEQRQAEAREVRRQQQDSVIRDAVRKVNEEAVTRRPGPRDAESSRPRVLPPVPVVEVPAPSGGVRKVQGQRVEAPKKRRGGRALAFRMGTEGRVCVSCVKASEECLPNDSKYINWTFGVN
jgi:hypothetical protein